MEITTLECSIQLRTMDWKESLRHVNIITRQVGDYTNMVEYDSALTFSLASFPIPAPNADPTMSADGNITLSLRKLFRTKCKAKSYMDHLPACLINLDL